MTNPISGKEALIALANGEDLQWRDGDFQQWNDVNDYLRLGIFNDCEFRLKPRTITINGIEVPAPFEPKVGEEYWCFSTQTVLGYGHNVYKSERADRRFINIGAWRTEDEVKQVVAVLRQIFGGV